MKRASCFRKLIYGNAGFSFIEIAIALIIIGMLSGVGLLLLGKSVKSTQRKETVQRLLEAKSALLVFAENQGNLTVYGTTAPFYYQKIGSSPIDVWNNEVSYIVSPNVTTAVQLDVCKRTKNPNGGYPGWTPASWLMLIDEIEGKNYVASGSGDRRETIVALLYSGGARVASNDNSGSDPITTYKRNYPSEDFDDIVVKITAEDLYKAIENFCTVTVEIADDARDISDPVNAGIFSVYNKTDDPLTVKPLSSANPGTLSLEVLASLGDEVVIKNAGGTLTFTVGSSLTPKTSAPVSDTRTPAIVPPLNPVMSLKIAEVAPIP